MNTTFIPTTDDFYPNYDNDTVQVKFHGDINRWLPAVPCYRVSVWGTDDYGLIYDSPHEHECQELYNLITSMKSITKQELKDLGFELF